MKPAVVYSCSVSLLLKTQVRTTPGCERGVPHTHTHFQTCLRAGISVLVSAVGVQLVHQRAAAAPAGDAEKRRQRPQPVHHLQERQQSGRQLLRQLPVAQTQQPGGRGGGHLRQARSPPLQLRAAHARRPEEGGVPLRVLANLRLAPLRAAAHPPVCHLSHHCHRSSAGQPDGPSPAGLRADDGGLSDLADGAQVPGRRPAHPPGRHHHHHHQQQQRGGQPEPPQRALQHPSPDPSRPDAGLQRLPAPSGCGPETGGRDGAASQTAGLLKGGGRRRRERGPAWPGLSYRTLQNSLTFEQRTNPHRKPDHFYFWYSKSSR